MRREHERLRIAVTAACCLVVLSAVAALTATRASGRLADTSLTAVSQAVPPSCGQRATVIGVRGSGDPQSGDVQMDKYGDPVHGMGKPGAAFAVDLANRLSHGAVTFLPIEYPAVGLLGDWRKIINAVGAATRVGFLGAYTGSVNDGKMALRQTISDEERLCPNVKLVLVGYSQGAQVVSDLYTRDLTAQQRMRIIGVVAFGDPYFNPADSAADHGSYDPTRHGILGTRTPYPTNPNARVFSICHNQDPICQGPGRVAFSQHTNYQTDPWTTVAAAAIAANLQSVSVASGATTIAATPALVPGHTYLVDLRRHATARLAAPGETQDGGLCPMWAGEWWHLNLRAGDTVSVSWTVMSPSAGFYQYLVFSPDTTDQNVNDRANNNQQLQFAHSDSRSGSASFSAPTAGSYPFIIGDGCPSTSGPFRFVVRVKP
jgi:hypothetical protein